jgi:CheY-like chemotaxis protein|tara:strand:- start:767 stop:2467 length:1701 start_codon:yes stop_codon:yes gene_type:complete
MSKSIIFFDATTNLVNPNNQEFINKNPIEIFINNEKPIDQEITRFVTENLLHVEYTNIIIPACFGGILSDFLGLRLATHIRCTSGINQTANIFLYSFTGVQDYFSNECFNILKTTGVGLIDYNIQSIINSTLIEKKRLSTYDLINQVKKLKIDVPLNYEDNHSIANEWAIYKWANTISANDDGIAKVESNLENDLYFKYLKTLYPIYDIDNLSSADLKLNFKSAPTVLYLDDEAEKGWKEIFEKIFIEENDIDFLPFGNELNEKAKKEVIDFSLKQVIDENVDVVILDFRLHKEDFEDISIQEVTGYQILKKIKEYNKGIQVIVFSATNKIWNFKALQEAGADAFILKESPGNRNESNSCKQSILNMIHSVNACFKMIFLKDIHTNIEKIKKHLNSISNITGNQGLSEGLMKMKFKNEIFIQLDLIFDCLKKSSEDISFEIKDENSYLNLSFISIYKIIELINDYFTDDRGQKLKSNSIRIQRYNQKSNDFSQIVEGYPSARDKIYTIIQFILNDEPSRYVQKINKFNKDRTNIIHPRTLKDYKKTTVEENMRFLSLTADILLKIN